MKRQRMDRWHMLGAIAFGVATSLAWLICPSPAQAACCYSPRPAQDAEADEPTIVEIIQSEADKVRSNVSSRLGTAFLDAARCLPPGQPRTVFFDESTRQYYAPNQADALPDDQRQALKKVELDESRYYITKYGTPIAYVRALDLIGEQGVNDLAGRKVLDFGYGGLGHLRLLASIGAEAVGVDVDSFLTALYCQETDQGAVPNCLNQEGKPGRIRLLEGRWPSTDQVIADVGEGYDLFISKNTLKRGYVHPEREANPRQLIDLGVDDAAYIGELHRILKPGGYVMIYNLSPKQAPPDKPYIPWADGRCPFEAELLEKAGFTVVALDVDDSDAARQMARALGWDAGMDVETGLFAHYTILQKR